MNLTKKEINNLDYSSYVGIVQETNRPSGGIKTIQIACLNAFINKNTKVLEIGCNTGFTSLSISALTNAKVFGIDINENSLKKAKEKSKLMGLDKKVKFLKASATKIPFKNEKIDVLWLSNVLSFIGAKEKVLKECFRVLKNNGFLIFVPIYYNKNPPKKLVGCIEKAIGCKINMKKKKDWINFIKEIGTPIEINFQQDFSYLNIKKNINLYIKNIFDKEIFQKIETKKLLMKKGREFMELFNENLKYAGYSICIIQKRKIKEEMELFLTKSITGNK